MCFLQIPSSVWLITHSKEAVISILLVQRDTGKVIARMHAHEIHPILAVDQRERERERHRQAESKGPPVLRRLNTIWGFSQVPK
jgi:hypothetical protein